MEKSQEGRKPNEIQIRHSISRSGIVRVFADLDGVLVPVYQTQVSRSKRFPHEGRKQIAKAARLAWRTGRCFLDVDLTYPGNPHFQGDNCGFDGNQSLNAGTYCCTCGWEEFDPDVSPEGFFAELKGMFDEGQG